MEYQIKSINVGLAQHEKLDGEEIHTGLLKAPIHDSVFVSKNGITGDEQADLINHGGVDKAVCAYSYKHYPYWEKFFGKKLPMAAFGENLTVQDIDEDDVCIGDEYRIGEVLLQVSLPRKPCFKLAKRYQHPEMPLRIQETGYSGFYFRVLEEGNITINDSIQLVKRHSQKVSVSLVNIIKYHDKQNKQELERIIEVPELANSWREAFAERLRN